MMQGHYGRLAASGLFILVIGTVLVLPGMSYAQDGTETATFTPTPDTGVIFGYRQEIVFPAVIRFVVAMNLGQDDTESITLDLRQESGFTDTIRLDLEENLLENAGIVNQYLYELDLATTSGLVPFETVSLKWEVKSKEGQTSTAEGEFEYEDQAHGLWESAGDPPLVLHWLNEHLAGDTIRYEILAAYGLLSQQTQLFPSFQFAIYDPGTQLCQEKIDEKNNTRIPVVISRDDQTEYPCSEEAFRQVYANGGIQFLQRSTFGYSELQDILIHQMAYAIYPSLWKTATVPAWFLEGLASLHRLHPGMAALEVVRDASRTDSLLDLSILSAPLVETADFRAQTLWESESYLLVLFLADRYGAEAPFTLAKDIVTHEGGFEAALMSLTRSDQPGLWDAWNRWLFTDTARNAVAWTPYSAATPTPTATATETPIPPTRTPSNTPTMTITPTSTFKGDQPPTVVVQRLTPTRILTITNTPLPPGSLPTARPRPAADTGESGSDNAKLGGVIALVMAAAVLIITLVIITFRRRK
jgi:hypothetical protein